LYRMTRNVALNRRRIERRRAGLLHAMPPSPASVMPDIAGQSDDDRLAVLVRSLSTELSRREREVFELADQRGMSTPACLLSPSCRREQRDGRHVGRRSGFGGHRSPSGWWRRSCSCWHRARRTSRLT
jgi:hypothetical protein